MDKVPSESDFGPHSPRYSQIVVWGCLGRIYADSRPIWGIWGASWVYRGAGGLRVSGLGIPHESQANDGKDSPAAQLQGTVHPTRRQRESRNRPCNRMASSHPSRARRGLAGNATSLRCGSCRLVVLTPDPPSKSRQAVGSGPRTTDVQEGDGLHEAPTPPPPHRTFSRGQLGGVASCPPKLTELQRGNAGVSPGRSAGQGSALCALGPLLLLQACLWDAGPSRIWQHHPCPMAVTECGSSPVVPHAGAAPVPWQLWGGLAAGLCGMEAA